MTQLGPRQLHRPCAAAVDMRDPPRIGGQGGERWRGAEECTVPKELSLSDAQRLLLHCLQRCRSKSDQRPEQTTRRPGSGSQ